MSGVCDPGCTDHPHCVCGAHLDDAAGIPVWTCRKCGTNVTAPAPQGAA